VLTVTSKNYGTVSFRNPPISPFVLGLIVALVVGIVAAGVVLGIHYWRKRKKSLSIQEEEETFLTAKSF
jgi:hypothetical protein